MGKRFEPEEILYDHGDFKIAYGTWIEDDEKSKSLALRWSNYPMNRAGKEAWLVLPSKLNISFLYALVYQDEGVDKAAIEKVMRQI